MTPTPERRETDAMLALVKSIDSRLAALDTKLTDHIKTEPQEWADLLEDMMGKAFPNGDPEGHREAHESQMAAIRDRAAFWKTMLIEVSKYGILGVLGWLVFHAWAAFVKGPQ